MIIELSFSNISKIKIENLDYCDSFMIFWFFHFEFGVNYCYF